MRRGIRAALAVAAWALPSVAAAAEVSASPLPPPRPEALVPAAPARAPLPPRRTFRLANASSPTGITGRMVTQTVEAPGRGNRGASGFGAGEEPVVLVADEVVYESKTGRVIARGNVQVFHGERTLTAPRIVYDSRTGTITAEGPIVLRDPSGATVFADFAELDEELREGLVKGARAVLGEDIRLSAVEARRVDERLSALSKAVYSPCRVCARRPTPLWRIRARRVIQDADTRRIYYRNATFDVLGVPVFWLPWFSHPDPRVERASGFLVPEFSHSSTYGYGIQVPYYWVIDDYSDFTFTPFFTTGDGPLALGEYRRAFAAGDLEVRFSGTSDDYTGENRFHGHVEAVGEFALADFGFGEGFRWGFNAVAVTDDGYLRRYDFSDEDRLTSELYLRRYRESGFFDLAALGFRSLRDEEPSGEIPAALPVFDFREEWGRPVAGGTLSVFASSEMLFREEGVDTSRFTLGADWEREALLPSGVALRGFAEVRGDLFVNDDFGSVEAATEVRLRPLAGIEVRYPLTAGSAGGATHVIEPVAQAVLAPWGLNGDQIPNEDSLATEFDETGLFDVSHFPGLDRAEEGPRLNLGVRYELFGAGPWRFDANLGRVIRAKEADEFSPGSGLDGIVSDWVGAWMVGYDPYVRIRQRMRLSGDLGITRNEIGAELTFWRADLDLSYIFLEADPLIEAPEDREEIIARGQFRLAPNWWLVGNLRRDLGNGEWVQAGGGIRFENECCRVELSVERDFTSAEDSPASTTVALEVRLFTLGNPGRLATDDGS